MNEISNESLSLDHEIPVIQQRPSLLSSFSSASVSLTSLATTTNPLSTTTTSPSLTSQNSFAFKKGQLPSPPVGSRTISNATRRFSALSSVSSLSTNASSSSSSSSLRSSSKQQTANTSSSSSSSSIQTTTTTTTTTGKTTKLIRNTTETKTPVPISSNHHRHHSFSSSTTPATVVNPSSIQSITNRSSIKSEPPQVNLSKWSRLSQGIPPVLFSDPSKATDTPRGSVHSVHAQFFDTPPFSRPHEDVKTVLRDLSHLTALKKLNSFLREEVVRSMTLKVFHPGTIIFQQGSIGESWYVIASGAVLVSTKASGPLATLFPGDAFGELALVNDAPRAASVMALEKSELLMVHKSDYTRILRISYEKDLADRSSDLALLPLLAGYPRKLLNAMAQVIQPCTYAKNSVILSRTSTDHSLFFVIKGSVRITRIDPETNTHYFAGTLARKAFFGHETVFAKIPLRDTIYTADSPGTVLYRIAAANALSLMTTPTHLQIRQLLDLRPSIASIKRATSKKAAQNAWTSFRQSLVSQIVQDATRKKRENLSKLPFYVDPSDAAIDRAARERNAVVANSRSSLPCTSSLPFDLAPSSQLPSSTGVIPGANAGMPVKRSSSSSSSSPAIQLTPRFSKNPQPPPDQSSSPASGPSSSSNSFSSSFAMTSTAILPAIRNPEGFAMHTISALTSLPQNSSASSFSSSAKTPRSKSKPVFTPRLSFGSSSVSVMRNPRRWQ